MKESAYIEGIKYRWRQAMKRREQAIKDVNHWAERLRQARLERDLEEIEKVEE